MESTIFSAIRAAGLHSMEICVSVQSHFPFDEYYPKCQPEELLRFLLQFNANRIRLVLAAGCTPYAQHTPQHEHRAHIFHTAEVEYTLIAIDQTHTHTTFLSFDFPSEWKWAKWMKRAAAMVLCAAAAVTEEAVGEKKEEGESDITTPFT